MNIAVNSDSDSVSASDSDSQSESEKKNEKVTCKYDNLLSDKDISDDKNEITEIHTTAKKIRACRKQKENILNVM